MTEPTMRERIGALRRPEDMMSNLYEIGLHSGWNGALDAVLAVCENSGTLMHDYAMREVQIPLLNEIANLNQRLQGYEGAASGTPTREQVAEVIGAMHRAAANEDEPTDGRLADAILKLFTATPRPSPEATTEGRK